MKIPVAKKEQWRKFSFAAPGEQVKLSEACQKTLEQFPEIVSWGISVYDIVLVIRIQSDNYLEVKERILEALALSDLDLSDGVRFINVTNYSSHLE